MNLKLLSDENLDAATINIVKSERELLTVVLRHLREVERRRLFSKYGYSSMYDYTIKRLGYSEDQAHRRISAMRLIRDLPQGQEKIEQKIESGALTLTHLSKVQTLFRQQAKVKAPKSTAQKLELLERIENTSKREAEEIIESVRTPELQVALTETQLQSVSLNQFSQQLQVKLRRLLEVRSTANFDLEKLLNEMADLALEKWDPIKKAERAMTKQARVKSDLARDHVDTDVVVAKECSAPTPKQTAYAKVNAARPAPVKVTRYIPSTFHHAVWLRDAGKCTNCGAKKFLEIDHVKPFAIGGSNELSNLRLLCRSCNQRHAIESYGANQMSVYLRAPQASYAH